VIPHISWQADKALNGLLDAPLKFIGLWGTEKRDGLLINFNNRLLKDGVKRFIL
jgi:hypothetical protein